MKPLSSMGNPSNPRRSWRAAGAVLLLVLVSYALGIFLFDRDLIVHKKIDAEGASVYANASDLAGAAKWSAVAFAALAVLALAGGKTWAAARGRGLGEGFAGQVRTLAPALFLVFGRFVEGKAVNYIVPLPLAPALAFGVLLAVVCGNARFHRGLRLGDFVRRRLGPPGAARRENAKTALLIAGLASLLVHLLTLSPYYRRFSSNMIFLGDEPKYLRMAYSLASDGDADLTDDFIGDDLFVYEMYQQARASGTRPLGDYSVTGRRGGIYHFHMPGISALIWPSLVLDFKAYPRDIPNTQPLMFLPAKMIVTRLWMLAHALGFFFCLARFYDRMFRSRSLLAVLLLAFLFGTAFPEFMLQVYPETAAGLSLFLGLNALFFPFRGTWTNRLALVIGIGSLPWLHQRFAPLAVSLYLLFLVRALRSRAGRREALSVSLGLAPAGAAYAYYFYAITGSPLPWSLYSLWGTSYTRAAIFPSGFFGYVFDTSSGLLVLFPVFLFALAGVYWGLARERPAALKLLAVILPYFFLISITPWHGLSWETTRMSLILFPVFLVFAGFTLRALAESASWAHLVFYSAAAAFLMGNKGGRFWEISLGNVLILPHQVGYIIQSAVVLILFFLAHWGLDLWAKKSKAVLSLDKLRGRIRERSGPFLKAAAGPVPRKVLAGLMAGLPGLYAAVFFNNWGDKTLSPSYFRTMAMVRRSPEARLHPLDRPTAVIKRSDPEFVGLFRREVLFQLWPGRQRESVRLGPAFLLERCPAGAYRLDLEFDDAPPELTHLSLDFMGETRPIEVSPRTGTTFVSATYLAFEDIFISPEFVLRHAAPLSRPVRAKLRFSPLPCLVFGRELIVLPGDDMSAEAVRARGSRADIVLTAYARKALSSYALRLAGADGVEMGSAAAVFPAGGKRRLLIPGDALPPADGSAVLSVFDGTGRSLSGRGAWRFSSSLAVLPARPIS